MAFIYLFNDYVLSTYYVLLASIAALNETGKDHCF